jgi:hypothetical protein
MAMAEATGPRFRLICEDARACTARYCFEDAKYWAIWNRTITCTKSLMIKKAVCRTHREAIEGKSWDEVSEDFRTIWQSTRRT